MLNQLDKRPDQEIARFIKDNLPFFQEMYFESGKQQDNITVWLVGLSTGAIALIISQFVKFNHSLHLYLKLSVLFLSVTVMLGLLFRILHLLLQKKDRRDMASIKGWLIGYTKSSTIPLIELPEDTPAELIVGLLHRHMELDTDVDSIKELAAKKNVEEWRKVYKEYTMRHERLEEVNQQAVKGMLEEFFDFMAGLEGVPAQTYEQFFKTDKSAGVQKRRLRKFCTSSYILMCISFAVSVLIISYGFITTDLKVNNSSTTTNQKVISPSKQVQSTQTDKPD